MAKARFQDVDAYIGAQPEAARRVLERVRGAIRAGIPDAEEGISYHMPTYRLGGKPVLYFAGWKRHYSLYPATDDLVAAFREALEPYEIEKGTIRFPLTDPVPVELIERIARFRAGRA